MKPETCLECSEPVWSRFLCKRHKWRAENKKSLPKIQEVIEEINVGAIQGFSDAHRVYFTPKGLKRELTLAYRDDLIRKLTQYDKTRGV